LRMANIEILRLQRQVLCLRTGSQWLLPDGSQA
jgi:hypothetical protein